MIDEEALPKKLRDMARRNGMQYLSDPAELVVLVDAAEVIENMIPALDLLQARLEKGCYIKKQDEGWVLFEHSGDGYVCHGRTVREMLVNLIFVDC